jgi:uncharacterized membrane protein YdbT with pleckstrin-like domain
MFFGPVNFYIMGYIENNLLPGETVVYKAKIHWIYYLSSYVLMILGIAFIIIGVSVNGAAQPWYILAAVAFFWGVIQLGVRLLKKIATEYVVTNRRVILKSGIIKRDALDLVLSKCEGLRITQSLMGQVFNYGSILVTTGEVVNSFDFVAQPSLFRNAITAQIHASQPTQPVQPAQPAQPVQPTQDQQ